MSASDSDLSEQRRYRERSPEKPRVGYLGESYAEWYLGFCPTGDVTTSALAETFAEKARQQANEQRELAEVLDMADERDHTQQALYDHSREAYHKRRAWGVALARLWRFSEGDAVDADALRESLLREGLRRHQRGRHGRDEEHVLVKAAGIVRKKAGLDRMPDERRAAYRSDYR